jgi:hypothetical protein
MRVDASVVSDTQQTAVIRAERAGDLAASKPAA